MAYHAAFDVDNGVHSHVAVLAATKHRADNHRRAVDGDMGVLDEGQIGVLATDTAVARAEDVAEVHINITASQSRSYGAAKDVDGGQARTVFSGLFIRCFVGIAHRRQVTAAIHVTYDAAALDGDVGVAFHDTSGDAVVFLTALRIGV